MPQSSNHTFFLLKYNISKEEFGIKMKKTIIVAFLVVACILNNFIVVNAEDTGEDLDILNIKSKSAILVEAQSGTVIYEKNADEQLKLASVTKVMTLLLTFEELSKGDITYEDEITISKHAASMGGSQCFFEEGEKQSVKDIIKCIEVASGNDAAVAMSEFIGGSEDSFVKMMNEKCKSLNMNNTNFVNACGLDADNHYSSARDISIMSRELITKHPEIYDFSGIWMDSITHVTARGSSRFDLANTNKFLKLYDGATGLKTGFTNEAGYCISATATRNDITLIAVVMGASTKDDRNADIKAMLDYGFNNCKIYNDYTVLDKDIYCNVKNGTKNKVKCVSSPNKQIVLYNCNSEDLRKEIELPESIEAPVKSSQEIGAVKYYFNENLIATEPIYASFDVDESTYSYYIKKLTKFIFMKE